MNSSVRNAVPTGSKRSSVDVMVADTMVAMAELAQQNRRAATTAATSTEASDSMLSAELAQQSQRAAAPVATPTAARGGPPVVSDSNSAELAQQNRRSVSAAASTEARYSVRSTKLAQQSRRAAAPAATPAPAWGGPPSLSDSMRSAAIAGWAIIAIFFGGFGTWAVTAPLNGAVVANGFVKVETNRKSVQHLDGGIVKELRVKEGDRVSAGDVLILLDDTQARAEYDVLWQQYLVLRASEERLRGELAQQPDLTIPDEFKALADDPVFSAVWRGQVNQFESRLAAIAGQRNVINEKIAQLEAQISGGEAQAMAYKAQLESVKKERDDIEPLVKRGLIAQPRYLQLERAGAGLEGQEADTRAGIAKARQAIAEQIQQMAQLDYDRMTDVNKDLRDTQAKLLEVIPKLSNAKAVLSRMEIRSPYSGYVVALTAFSVGGVITKGDKILDVVPEQESLVIEAQIPVDDISEVHPNMRADVHLTAYKARITPVVRGKAMLISADRLTDKRGDNSYSYYTALVTVDQSELEALPNVRLYPGMPATVMFPTVERTALNYLIGPLVQSFNRAFRQK